MREDFETIAQPELLKTVEFLCDGGNFGYAGLSDDYLGVWRYGELASWIPLGANVCRNTDLFFGLEKQLLDLQDEDGACLTLPRVGLPTGGDDISKVSVEVFWDETAAVYHIIVHRLVAESEVELELLKQIRARRLAEENFQATREKLARQEMLLNILMEKLPVAAAILDRKRRYLFATRQWAKDFRIECEPLIGQDIINAGPDIPSAEARKLDECLSGLTVNASIESTAIDRDNVLSHRWTQFNWQAPDGSADGALIAAENVSDLIAENRRLSAENEEYRQTNRRLSDRISILGHDLRAPLRSLRQLSDAHDNTAHGSSSQKFIDVVHRHTDRLNTILSELDDDSVHPVLENAPSEVDIAALLRDIIETLPGRHRFSFEITVEKATIPIDATAFDQVFRNLLGNALKHHDRGEGGISISCTAKDDHWSFQLTDDGPGIPLAEQSVLFVDADESRMLPSHSQKQLGLKIIKRAMDEVGGTIDVRSDPARHRGTTFTLCWPAHRQDHEVGNLSTA